MVVLPDMVSGGPQAREKPAEMVPEQEQSNERRFPGWGAILRTQEALIFLTGVACAAAIVAWFAVLSGKDLGKAATIMAIVTTHLTGGRAFGVSAALSRGFEPWEAIALGVLIEGAVVCFFFSAFCLSFKRLIVLRFLSGAIENIQRSAASQRSRLLRWGVPGLIMFVWFPFFMTGPVVGSVIGFLLGMRPWVVTGVVLFGTVLAIVSWTFAIGPVVEWAQRIGEFFPLMVVFILLIVVVSYRVSKHLEAQQARGGSAAAGQQEE